MASKIGDTVPDCELEHHSGARASNCGRGEDVIITGAVSEWVLMGAQWWHRVARRPRQLLPSRNAYTPSEIRSELLSITSHLLVPITDR
jgi:hypothetical protein